MIYNNYNTGALSFHATVSASPDSRVSSPLPNRRLAGLKNQQDPGKILFPCVRQNNYHVTWKVSVYSHPTGERPHLLLSRVLPLFVFANHQCQVISATPSASGQAREANPQHLSVFSFSYA